MTTYSIFRMYADTTPHLLKHGVTLEEAKAHCADPETSSRTCTTDEGRRLTEKHGTWFDGYEED